MQKPSADLQQPSIRWLTPEDFEYVCFDLARELLTYQEPIPDYSTRDNGLLESALGAPSQTFDQKLLYPTLQKQATILFYSLIKNHPFRNGNKRIAVMALLAFLSINAKWINIKPKKLYETACMVSESLPNKRNEILDLLEKMIIQDLIDYPI
mgnify:CR=1 FL=1